MDGNAYAAGVRAGRLKDGSKFGVWDGIILAVLCLMAWAAISFWQPGAHHTEALAMSTVKMEAPGWTGSGVYLGKGYVLTAGHVADGLPAIDIELSTGAKTHGTVLWTNTKEFGGYDVALVYSPDLAAESSPISCEPTHVGDDITIVGNPGPLTFLKTWGRVSGAIASGQWDNWKYLVALDITAAPGVSGGPVFNAAGEVVGILVSGLVLQDRGVFPYSMMVPSTAICQLLAR